MEQAAVALAPRPFLWGCFMAMAVPWLLMMATGIFVPGAWPVALGDETAGLGLLPGSGAAPTGRTAACSAARGSGGATGGGLFSECSHRWWSHSCRRRLVYFMYRYSPLSSCKIYTKPRLNDSTARG